MSMGSVTTRPQTLSYGLDPFSALLLKHGKQFKFYLILGSILLQMLLGEAQQSTGKRHAVFAMLVKWTQCSYPVSISRANDASHGTCSIINGAFSATLQYLSYAI